MNAQLLTSALFLAFVMAGGTALAQTTTSEPGAASPQEHGPSGDSPPRRVGHAFVQTTLVNVVYGLANLVRGQDTAKVAPESWWLNLRHGWVWDLDGFTVNQIGHPYQGNNYFTTGRANGLGFWESAGMTAFGSATWEFFGETNKASANNLINTTLGGIALGEMLHPQRRGWSATRG